MTDIYYADFLVERPATQRFWVVRASGGDYVKHFRQHGVIAIGHLDKLALTPGAVDGNTLSDLDRLLQKAFPDRPKSSITSHSNQAQSFCAGIAVDDIVITVSARGLIFGRVAGTAYIDSKALSVTDVYGGIHEMDHQLRRAVEWGPEISRANVPSALVMTMLAHQTVFNIDEYWDSIYHLLYPCFYSGDRLYLSANIREREELDNYSISQLFGLLSGVEAAARQLTSSEAFPAMALPVGRDLELNLTSKAEFMSPGSIWSTVLMDSTTMLWCTVIYVMLFGGDVKFFKADGLMDKQTRQKAWNLVLKLIEKYDFQNVKKKLKVDVPRVETKALDAPRKRQKKAAAKNIVTLDNSPSIDKPEETGKDPD